MDTLLATPALRPWVAEMALLRPDRAHDVAHLPDAATALVYRRTGARAGDLRVIGPRSRASYHPGKDLPMCLRARLRPGAARAVFGVPVAELRDRAVPLADLWGGAAGALERRLNGLTGVEAILRAIETAFLGRVRDGLADPHDALLREAVASLSTTSERFAALARRLSMSERGLRDLFTDRVGLPPKRFTRVQRVRAVAAATGQVRWAGLAAATGYYDQSHMTSDFHTLMGVTPAAFHAGHRPAVTPCTADGADAAVA